MNDDTPPRLPYRDGSRDGGPHDGGPQSLPWHMPPALPRSYEDRTTLLTVLGSLVIASAVLMFLGGLFYAVVFPILMRMAPAEEFGPAGSPFPVTMMFGYAAIMFVYGSAGMVVGVGLVRARRWARAVAHAACWIYAVGTAVGLLYVPFWIPKFTSMMTDPALGGDPSLVGFGSTFFSVFMWGGVVISVLMNLAIPVAGILLLGSDSARRTVVDRDPVSRWTDPLSTEALASGLLWLAAAGYVPLLSSLFGPHAAASVSLGGPTGVALILLGVVGAAWVGWVTVRARPYAWAANVVGVVLYGGIGTWLLYRLDFVELYRGMLPAMSEEDLDSMSVVFESLYGDPKMLALPTLVMVVLALGFLFWARKRFALAAVLFVATSCMLLSGCAAVQPWDRDELADPIMRLQGSPLDRGVEEHHLEYREGSSGGTNAEAGGCGCG